MLLYCSSALRENINLANKLTNSTSFVKHTTHSSRVPDFIIIYPYGSLFPIEIPRYNHFARTKSYSFA